MLIFHGLSSPRLLPQCALTIGNFDGVHLGHQAMLTQLKARAAKLGLPTCVLTFAPHPREFFAPQSAPARIITLRDKLAMMRSCGIDQVVLLAFDSRLAALPAPAFIDDVLMNGLHMRYLLIGDDFCFGAKRTGNYAVLQAAAPRLGFELESMPTQKQNGTRISSSQVRAALGAGDLQGAQLLLGRPYCLSGHVVHGAKLGRELGFATLNIRIPKSCAASGIFVATVHGLTERALRGVANLGVRPSLDPSDVNGGRILLETHCLDWPAPLTIHSGYGKIIRVELLHKLHAELHYPDLPSLKAGIQKDCEDAAHFFQSQLP